MNPWQVLGVAPDIAVADLRRRYAALIKEFRPETHPQEFARIREAYELALREARRREAQEAQTEAAETPAADVAPPPPIEPPAAAAQPEPARQYAVATDPEDIAIEALAASDAPDPPVDEPTLGELFHHFMAVAHPVGGSDDEALRPMLRMLLRTRMHGSLDDSQTLEFSLLRWFLESEQPALTMLFETGHAFGWHEHPDRLAAWLSNPAMRRIEGLLALSRDLVFARHYSGNAWVRRLQRPQGGVVPLAWRPATLDALGWAARWRQLAAQTAPALAGALQAHALQRLQGTGLWSTDVLVGLLAALLAPDLSTALPFALGGIALACWLRVGAQLLRFSPRTRRLHAPLARFIGLGWPAIVLGLLGYAVLAIVLAGLVAAATGIQAPVVALLLPAPAVLLLWLGWRIAALAEVFAASLFDWRAAIDRLEFKRMLQDREALNPVAPPQRPYGPRLAWRQRLRAIGEARRLQDRELAQGARPPLPRVVLNLGSGKQPGWPRMVWIALWVAFGLARVTHLIGAPH